MVIEEITGRIARDLEHLKQFTAAPACGLFYCSVRLNQAAVHKRGQEGRRVFKGADDGERT